MKSQVDQQIEQIADEATGPRVSVIVQMEAPQQENLRDYLEATSQAIDQRGAIITARSLVPPHKDALKTTPKGAFTQKAKEQLQTETAISRASFVASNSVRQVPRAELRDIGLSALKPLLESDWVYEVQEKSERIEKSDTTPEPVHFWSSGSAVLELTASELQELPTRVPNVAAVYPNRTVKLPPVFRATSLPGVVADNKANTWGLSRTGALSVWGAFGSRGKGIKVAVLDTGVDPNHPDLKGKVVGFAEFDRDGQTVIDDVAKAYDSDRHGTHCAGIIVGGQASGRWIGMAPEAKILAGIVLKPDAPGQPASGTDSQILAGIEWAIKNDVDVISMSLGGMRLSADVIDTYTRALINANRVGIPVVTAVGNWGSQTSDSPGNDYFAFTVGATDSQDRAAGFSGGRTQIVEKSRYIREQYLPVVYSKPDVSAPGVDIYSSVPGGGWEAWSGTSMATPHVAGAMALLLSPPTTVANVEGLKRIALLQQLMTSTVTELGESGQNHRFGFGRIDVLRAFGYAKEQGFIG